MYGKGWNKSTSSCCFCTKELDIVVSNKEKVIVITNKDLFPAIKKIKRRRKGCQNLKQLEYQKLKN